MKTHQQIKTSPTACRAWSKPLHLRVVLRSVRAYEPLQVWWVVDLSAPRSVWFRCPVWGGAAPNSVPATRPGQVASPYPQGRAVGGRRAGVRPTDPPGGLRESGAFDLTDENLALMEKGRPPIGRDGLPVELHHRNQNPLGPLDEMTSTTHDTIPHPITPSQIDRGAFAGERSRYWVSRARELLGQR